MKTFATARAAQMAFRKASKAHEAALAAANLAKPVPFTEEGWKAYQAAEAVRLARFDDAKAISIAAEAQGFMVR